MKILILTALVAVSAQSGVRPFAGTWTAAYNGQTHIRLELRDGGGALTGQISVGNVHLDKDGVIDAVNWPASTVTPIFDVALRGGVLSFARKDSDDTDHFEMRLDGDAAELRFIATPEDVEELRRNGIAVPKPVRLTRSPR